MKNYTGYEIFKINQAVLRLFKKYLIINFDSEPQLKDEALPYGILLDQYVNKDLFDEIIKQYGIDGYALNQTFHKSLETVAQEDILTLYIQQIVHYITTYGYESLGITDGSVYIPNEKLEVPVLENGVNLTFISQMDERELIEKVVELATSKIALSKQTVKDLLTLSDFLIEGIKDVEDVTNKELKIVLYKKYGIVPKNNIEFVRFLVNHITDQPLLIKDKRTVFALNNWDILSGNAYDYLKQYEEKYGLEPLAEIFNRYTWVFVGLKRNPQEERKYYNEEIADERMKKAKEINHIVNRLYKLAKKHHKPFIDNNYINHIIKYISKIQNEDRKEDILKEYISKKTIWEIIKVYDYLRTNSDIKAYKIRNGKVYVEEKRTNQEIPQWAKNVFKEYIVKRLEENIGEKTIYLPTNIDFALPQSEKQFIGNVPFNSEITLPKEGFVIGIHWNNLKRENGGEARVDLDIKLFSNKYSVSWNSNYRSEDAKLIYSGDVTNAPIDQGGASEYIFIDPSIDNISMTFRVNNYTREVGPIPFDLIIAKADKTNYLDNTKEKNSYIVNPNSIIAKIPCEIEKGQSEHNLGILTMGDDNATFILTNLSTSDLPVSKGNILDEYFRDYIVNHSKKQAYLTNMLMEAHANISITKTIEKMVPSTTIKVGTEDKYMIATVPNTELGTKYPAYTILEEGLFKKEEVPVDIDLSLEALNKATIIDLFKDNKNTNN